MERGDIAKADGKRIVALIEQYGFATALPVERKQLLKAVEGDKKRSGDTLHIIIPTSVGTVEDRQVKFKDLAEIL